MTSLVHKTLAALAHPITLVSLVILLLNDHLFRILQPSWFTGKLGDAAWLFFAPLALLLFLAAASRILPVSSRRNNLLPLMAYALVGGVFVLGNTSPGVAAWLVQMGEGLFRVPQMIVCDPSDLLALPFLAGSYLLWRLAPASVSIPGSRSAAGALAALLAAVLTVANSAAPQYGVDSLALSSGDIIACSAYEDYVSTDGGYTWQIDSVGFSDACRSEWEGKLAVEWQDGGQYFRYNEDAGAIERSTDQVSWHTEYVLRPASEAGQALYAKENTGNIFFSEGPYDAVFDPVSGNVVVAMGLEGVLVRTTDGTWQQVGVGQFSPRKVNTLSSFYLLLNGELALALGLLLLLLGSAGAKMLPKILLIIPMVIGWLGWTLAVMLKPALYANYPLPFAFVLVGAAVFIVPVGAVGVFQLVRRDRNSLFVAVLLALGGFVFFLAPFVLWALDIIPSYSTAMFIASALALLDLVILLLVTGDRQDLASLPVSTTE